MFEKAEKNAAKVIDELGKSVLLVPRVMQGGYLRREMKRWR